MQSNKPDATQLLIDLDRYKEGKMSKTEIKAKWEDAQWPSQAMREFALWEWREAGL